MGVSDVGVVLLVANFGFRGRVSCSLGLTHGARLKLDKLVKECEEAAAATSDDVDADPQGHGMTTVEAEVVC